MALPSFHQHLKLLEASGLVNSHKQGRVRTYRLRPEPLEQAAGWLDGQRGRWEHRFDQLDELVWTSALLPGYRPLPADEEPGLLFTAELTFESVGDSTRYSARAIHGSSAAAETHQDMGFVDGWGTALDQLVEHMSQ